MSLAKKAPFNYNQGMDKARRYTYNLLRSSEKFFKTDMVYLVRNGLWINMNFVFVSVFSFFLSIAFANILPKETYGIYQYILSVSALLAAFTFTGMNTAIAQSVSRGFDGVLARSIRPQLIWNLVPTAAAFAWSIYYFLNNNSELGLGMMLLGLSLPIVNTFNSYGAFLTGKQDFKKISLYSISSGVIYYTLMFLCLILFPSAIILVLINFAVSSISSVYFYRKVIWEYKPSTVTDPEISKYAYHLSFMGVLSTLAGRVDSLLVFHFLGATSLAAYTIATLLPEKLGGVFKFITSSAFPKFADRNIEEIRASIVKKIFFLLIGAATISGIYILIAPFVFKILYPQYTEVIPFSQAYSLTLVSVVSSLVITAFNAKKLIKELYIISTVVPILQITIQIAGIILLGLWGLIIAKVISTIILGLSTLILMYRHDQPVTRI